MADVLRSNPEDATGAEGNPVEAPGPIQLKQELEESLGKALKEANLAVPQEKQTRLVRRVVQQIRAEFFQGPLPPPKVLGEYDSVVPGLARQIAEMARTEQNHRHSWEKGALYNSIICQSGGLILGYVLLAACVSAYVYLITHGIGALAASPLLAPPVLSTIRLMFPNIGKPFFEDKADKSQSKEIALKDDDFQA